MEHASRAVTADHAGSNADATTADGFGATFKGEQCTEVCEHTGAIRGSAEYGANANPDGDWV